MAIETWMERLPALNRLVQRLTGLPETLGEIDLAPLRDTSVLRELDRTGGRPESLQALLHRSRREPDLTLAAFGAAELLHQLASQDTGEAGAEFGRLLAATGEVDAGLALLRRTVAQVGPSSSAAWYLLLSLRLLNDLDERRRLLAELRAYPDSAMPESLSNACRIESWWQSLLGGEAQVAGLRYQLECFLHSAYLNQDHHEALLLRARALHCLAVILARQSSTLLLETAAFRLREAIDLYRESDLAGLSRTLDTLGRVQTRLGQHEQALRAFNESLKLKLQLRDIWGVGATLNGLAQQRQAQGRPLLAADLLESNLRLMPLLEAPVSLVKQNQSQLVSALLTACFPLEERPATALPRLTAACAEFARPPCSDGIEPLSWFYNAARRWLEARQIPDPGARRERLMPAIRLLRDSLSRFEGGSHRDERSRIALYLALALMDRAAIAAGSESSDYLDQARGYLDQADEWLTDLLLRPYLEWGFAQWALAKRRFDDRQAHLASARHYAELTGNVLLQGVVDDSLNAHLSSPVQQCPSPLVLSPGQTLEIPLRLTDWRHRPLPRFGLRVRFSGKPGPFGIENEQPRTDESGQARVIVRLEPVPTGTAELEIRTRAGRPLGTVQLEARDLEIEGWSAPPEDAFVLRQLFGVGYRRLVVRRAFEEGLSGMRVLLVHPQMRSPTGAGVWNAQPCIVKLGAVEPLRSEWERYRHWVRELLPANVTRMTRFVAWERRAGILMSLIGTGWSRSRSEHDWLLDASPFDAHHLLEAIFHRDLGLSWYTNTGEDMPESPLLHTYAQAIPPVWTITDTQPPGGLLSEPPSSNVPRLDPLTGLRRDADSQPEVALDELTVLEVRRVATGWEYELAAPSGLRVNFLSPLRLDAPPRCSIRGRPTARLLDRLERNLLDCCAVWRELHPDEPGPSYEPDRNRLRLPVGEEVRDWGDPLAGLADLWATRTTWCGSVIHGDLHGRNVLVDTQGHPYYIDFAKTRFGPTLYDFIKHEQYLWHDLLARRIEVKLGPLLGWLFPWLEQLRDVSHPLYRHKTPVRTGTFPDWLATLEQSLQTLRVLGRAYFRGPNAVDFHAPFAGLAALMLRWCGPREAAASLQRTVALQGLIQAALAVGSHPLPARTAD